ncbi:phosphoribosyl-AMP cyclohydrolase [uncultured Bifidobacterium sp.]|uniref:phosphoribosyl-AMP cyclohydrolase n=1 Tax=uncultured Bifidobacterium sp. TaxID=165187 RepID=UPI002607373C|nr:phosphoribosyl-AMP cyclohydrolase [uncultured Bifidobacterium sp.]
MSDCGGEDGVERAEDAGRDVLDPSVSARLKRDGQGLVVAVVQQYDTHEVLMVGYMNDEALRRTLTTGRVTYWSRSRQEYWRKGDTSGHVQFVKGVSLDCDGDALLISVDQVGAACHTGRRSCFDTGGPLPVVVGSRADALPMQGGRGR